MQRRKCTDAELQSRPDARGCPGQCECLELAVVKHSYEPKNRNNMHCSGGYRKGKAALG